LTDNTEWLPIDTLPPPGERPIRVFVLVQGHQYHNGANWIRQNTGISRTKNTGFYPEDIARIEADSGMDAGTGKVTHYIPDFLPPYPEPLDIWSYLKLERIRRE